MRQEREAAQVAQNLRVIQDLAEAALMQEQERQRQKRIKELRDENPMYEITNDIRRNILEALNPNTVKRTQKIRYNPDSVAKYLEHLTQEEKKEQYKATSVDRLIK